MKQSRQKNSPKKSFPVWAWAGLAVAVLIIAGLALSSMFAPAKAGLPREISVSEASQKMQQGAFVLDVREPSEWDQFHIPGSTLIPLGELPNRLSSVPTDREVVVVCRSGNRSQTGRDILLQAGYENVTSMAGGVVQWQGAGLPITSGR